MTLIRATHFGPAFAPGQPRQIVVHSVESEIVSGLARSLANGWFRNPANKTSAHTISDPHETIDMVQDTQRAWHCGNGNNTSLGNEHVGRARFTRVQWTTPAGLAMLRNGAQRTARQCIDHKIRPRWLSLAQLARNEDGLCTHNDMRLVRGGTTHTDPGPGFPYDLYLQMVKEAMGLGTSTVQEDDMPFTEAQLRAIVSDETEKTVRKLLTSEKLVAYSDQRLRPAKDLSLSITGALGRSSAYDSNASGGVDQIARAQGLEPEDRK
ncbi:MAG: hypothetical protein BGO26_06755 [Actinobacteria bacterium 69-20]|nr:N-acetylmuramoyl-L-alanine amidase [Actinomycetota bacterium]OJV28134.1 MAG: hypothetical protein BGO26_06755 [Actinobacteria bacterium 69-20]